MRNALPLIMTHGWPGSIIELLDTVAPASPTRLRTAAPPRTHSTSCLPSLPGYGPLRRAGRGRLGPWGRTARGLGRAHAPTRLHPPTWAQGGDVGAGVADTMGRQAPEALVGIHTKPARAGR